LGDDLSQAQLERRKPTTEAPTQDAGAGRRHSLRNAFRRALSPLPAIWVVGTSLAVVVLATVFLYQLQTILVHRYGQAGVRPYGIGFLAPIILMTALGGRRIGLWTLILSCLAFALVLAKPSFGIHRWPIRSEVEIVLLVIVGIFAIGGVGAMRENAAMLADIGGTAEGVEIENQIRQAVEAVAGVDRLHACTIYRRGLDLYIDTDIIVEGDLPLSEVRAMRDRTERAISAANPLIFRIRVRVL
jgi:hypothetical protein